MTKWKPIETAPKDGTRILVYGYWKGEICGQVNEPDVWLCSMTCDHFDIEGCDSIAAWVENPTHWMPLPQPPGKNSDQQKETA